MPLRPLAERSRSAPIEHEDAVRRALVDPAWRSQLLIGITVLNWLQQDESDREDLTELARQLATPGQRRLRLHLRWAERDLASLAHPNTPVGAHLRGVWRPGLNTQASCGGVDPQVPVDARAGTSTYRARHHMPPGTTENPP